MESFLVCIVLSSCKMGAPELFIRHIDAKEENMEENGFSLAILKPQGLNFNVLAAIEFLLII